MNIVQSIFSLRLLMHIAIAGFLLPVALVSQSEWIVRTYLPISGLNGVHFWNASQGMVVGSFGGIYRTNDGGAHWDSLGSGTTSHLNDVWYINKDIVLVAGYDGEIRRSTDSGNSWVPANKDTSARFTSIHFCDEKNGILTGSNGIIMRTTDGGMNWTHQISGTKNFLYEGVMLSPDTALVVGVEGLILRTVDGGATWNTVESGTTIELLGMTFFDADTGVIVGNHYNILRTTDGGASWSFVQQGTSGFYYAAASSGDTAVVVKGGGTLRSTDAGLTWEEQPNNSSSILEDVHLVDGLTGTAVGVSGVIVQTAPGGFTSVEQNTDIPNAFLLEQNYPNPFNPSTTISFTISTDGMTSVKVYDMLGREVATLVNGELRSGEVHQAQFNAENLASGIYVARLQSNEKMQTMKMLLVK